MKKRSLLTSVAASTVLAGVLMLSGCGGSSTSEDNINSVDESKGIATIAVGDGGLTMDVIIPVQGRDANNDSVETAEVKLSKDAPELANECKPSSPCEVKVVQNSMCVDELTQDQKDRANTLRPQVPDSEGFMVMYAGDLNIVEAYGKLTNVGMAVTVKLPMCALMPTTIDGTTKRGPRTCDILKIYVTDADGSRWVEASAYTEDTSGCNTAHKDYYVTFNVTGLPTDIAVFVLTDNNIVTGVTGGTGGTGY